MAKEKRIFLDIPRLYKRTALDLIMFGYVTGIRKAMPSVSVRECIAYFVQDNELSEDDCPFETLYITYFRMQKDFYDSQRSCYD
jgi:hypothetical protein